MSERQRLMQRWEEILNELADIDHLRVIDGDPALREEQLQAELREVEFQITESDDGDRRAA